MKAGTLQMIGAVLFAGCAATSSASEVVFNSIGGAYYGFWFIHETGEAASAIELPGGFENERQAGQRITLGGTARHIDGLEVRFSRPAQPSLTTASVILRFYEATGQVPGDLIWSGVAPVTFDTFQQHATISIAPNTTVPETFIWTFEVENIQSNGFPGFGVSLASSGVSIGSLDGVILSQDSTTLAWEDTPLPAGMMIRLTAVPAPGAGLVLAAGVALLCCRRGRGRVQTGRSSITPTTGPTP